MLPFSEIDLQQLRVQEQTAEKLNTQLALIRKGSLFANLGRPCVIGDGIHQFDQTALSQHEERYDRVRAAGRVMKFVPASGAATRMFRFLFQAQESLRTGELLDDPAFTQFQERLKQFAFWPLLQARLKSLGETADALPSAEFMGQLLKQLLEATGLGFGQLPKGLIPFHQYQDGARTPFEEHLHEGMATIADDQGKARFHFTVSPEHQKLFESLLNRIQPQFQSNGIELQVSFSLQKKSTNTPAATPDYLPFRDDSGQLVFRPGGHGALIENLDDLGADLVFIKNIDNVVPDRLRHTTNRYKKALAGLLLDIQTQCFHFLDRLDHEALTANFANEILDFCQSKLGFKAPASWLTQPMDRLTVLLQTRLNRPIRVCGMVKNQGEPGGGPFWINHEDGSQSLQIIEGAQIDRHDEGQAAIASSATHFNPVDLVCGLRDRHQNPFVLADFVDPSTCFISEKSMAGRPLLALELPGLWNGAMAKWNTCFVEVPLITFNPVKTLNDLLRPEHLPCG